jgi:hypothetical protein
VRDDDGVLAHRCTHNLLVATSEQENDSLLMRWVDGSVSNYDYLMELNRLVRTPWLLLRRLLCALRFSSWATVACNCR